MEHAAQDHQSEGPFAHRPDRFPHRFEEEQHVVRVVHVQKDIREHLVGVHQVVDVRPTVDMSIIRYDVAQLW